MFSENPDYKLELFHEASGVSIYTPVNIASGYHTCRLVEATNQQIYANAGATREVLEAAMDDMILRCNKPQETETLRTDIGSIANSIKYRLKYPVDQHCAIRMGAILSFMEYTTPADNETGGNTINEDPNKCELWWINKKTELAMQYPELYTFFLTWGVQNIQTYRQAFDISTASDYFVKRDEAIRSLQPQSTT